MKYGWAIVIFGAAILSTAIPRSALAVEKATILIVEVQTGSSNSTGEDFVELFNQSETVIDLSTWRLDYLATGATSKWSKKASLSGSLNPGDRYLITTKDYLSDISDADLTSGMSKSGGSLRVVSVGSTPATDQIVDLIGWGTAKEFMGEDALPGTDDGKSLKRKVDEDGQFIDSQNNMSDFVVSAHPSPSSASDRVVNEETDKPEQPADSETQPIDPGPALPAEGEEAIASPTADGVGDIRITELFIDPASPQTDAEDEFVELYNAGSMVVDMSDYIIQAGLTFSHSFVISGIELLPGQYVALPASETGLALSNSGGRVRVINASGRIIDETAAYETAKVGQSFALNNNIWQWTERVTPGAPNSIVSNTTTAAAKAPAAVAATSKKKAASKAITPKSAKSSTAKSTSKKATKSDTSTTPSNASAVTATPHLNTRWLVGLGSLAILYAGWEYRDDIKTKYYQLRKNRGSRSSDR